MIPVRWQWGHYNSPRYLIASIFPRPVPIICVWKWAISWYIPQHLGKMMINHWIYTIFRQTHLGMDQYLVIPFLGGWTSIYQLFWCLPGVQGFDTLPFEIWGWFPYSPWILFRKPGHRGFSGRLGSTFLLHMLDAAPNRNWRKCWK